ncbi:MAG: N-acetyltransferase [Deltaproteobacteria bacterium]|nr:N-acetyltransferase [Deltaproteobacteria bacterium]
MEARASSAAQPEVQARQVTEEMIEHPFGAPPKDLPAFDPGPATRLHDAAGVRLEAVDLANSGDRRRFLALAPPLYQGDPNWITPLWMERMHFLDPKKNPGIAQIEMRALIAVSGGRDVGRITAHVDHAYDRYHATRAGWFGFFECINDRRVAHALLRAACDWLRQKGATEVIGPMNFNTNGQAGLLVQNFDRPPCIEMTYNPRYYEELITSFGFGKAKDLYAWWIDVRPGLDNPKLQRIHKLVERIKKKEGVVFRTLHLNDLQAELGRVFGLYNAAWQKNWGFVPLTKAEFDEIATQLKPILREELLFLVEVDGKPVGFSITLPDVNEVMPKNGRLFPFGWVKLALGMKRIKHARLFTLGVIPEYRKRGLEAMMMLETALRARDIGIEGGEIGWTLEDNWLINRAIESMDGKLDRIYRLFGLTLS